MRNNKLIIGDTEYILDAAYRTGALAFRAQVPYHFNPYSTLSDKNSQWDYGHAHESEGLHHINGVDIITAPQNGTVYYI